jgi:translocation and assembly module TamB
MWTNFKAQFVIDGPRIHLDRIDLETDGAATTGRGDVDMAHWPEQTYQVQSRVKFPRMKQLFFKDEKWDVSGDGQFGGTFHLSKAGPDLAGAFASEVAGVNEYRFPELYGSLRWTKSAFDVWNAGSKFYGGDARFTYGIKPFGAKVRPAHHFESTITDLDLARFTDFEQVRALRFAGTASLHNVLDWPSGRFSEHRGGGHLVVTPPAGTAMMAASLAAAPPPDADRARPERRRFAPMPLPAHLPIAGELTYGYGPDEITLEDGRFVTGKTHVTFGGTTAYGDRSRLPFHVVSGDWQESDQVLVGIIKDFGGSAHDVEFGGRGVFDGVMTGAFRNPRVEGMFSGEDLRGFDTLWGSGVGRIVVERSYLNVTDGVVRLGDSEIRADGLFSLGYPRDDGGEEINARIRVVRRGVEDLRHAFGIDDYRVSGLLSGEFHITSEYERPLGFGSLTIEQGLAYGEPFEKATAAVRFDGRGVRLDNVEIAKGSGAITGAAFVGWDATYSFNADGRRIPVDAIAGLAYPRAPLSGLAEFSAAGNGRFDQPRYDVKFRVNDLFVAEEGVGQVTGTLAVQGQELRGEIDAASPRLAITGTGRVALTRQSDAEITFRFHDSSLDPYVRLFVPSLSQYTTAVASGSIRVVGELADFDHLLVDGTVDTLELRLLDYAVHNATPIRLALDRQQIRIDELRLEGVDTRLRVGGTVGLRDQRIALQMAGDANLGILQGFFPGSIRGSGRAELTAGIDGPLHQPQFSGNATITDGRIRHFSVPNSLDAINGAIRFDAGGIHLDGVTATVGGGLIQFGGRVGLDGYVPADLDITARGNDLRLRYPEGIRSVVDMDLTVRGNVRAPALSGLVTVKNALWNRRVDAPGSLFDLAARRSAPSAAPGSGAEQTSAFPLKFDVRILVPSTLRVENNLVRMVANADLTLRGTYDRPVISGHADIERGEVTFEGRRYRITRGSMDFTNPVKIEPFFDVEAVTNVRVPGQTYRVTVGFAGTPEQMRPTLNSDPYLRTSDVLALLFSDAPRTDNAELRALQNPNQAQTDILTARATQALAGPLSAQVGKVVEQTFGVDTFQLTPSFVDPYQLQQQTARLNPTARLTIGKRISDRVYLTFSRSLNSIVNDQIVLLEYDESDRVSWILSRNEDSQTYALEFRVRHVF